MTDDNEKVPEKGSDELAAAKARAKATAERKLAESSVGKASTDDEKNETKTDDPRAEEPKAEEPKPEEPKADEPKPDAEPTKDEPKKDEPKKEEPAPAAAKRSSSRGKDRPPMIVVKGLKKSFGDRVILKDVNYEIERGKVVVIMGGSGSGKSTMLKCLIGAHPIDCGEIWLDGAQLSGPDVDHLDSTKRHVIWNDARRKFGVLFQSAALFGSMTVGENVALPIRFHTDLAEETIDIMVKMKLDQVGLGHAEDLLPSEISGGMAKRAGLARAIALDPKVIFYDEPSAGLDPIVVTVVDHLIKDLSKALGITSVVITHVMESAFRIADEIVMLYQGEVIFRGTPEECQASDDDRVKQFIAGEVPVRDEDELPAFLDDVL